VSTRGGGASVEAAVAGGAGDELVIPDDRLKPGTAPATGFSLSSGPERVA
jgi:hypothetical protein